MDVEELQATLQDAGLSPYQAEVYVTLLELGEASATEIGEHCTVPRPRIYDVLRDLSERGYVETYRQDTLRARSVDPEPVLDDLRRRSETFAAAAETVEELWERPQPEEHAISVFGDFDTIVDRVADAVRGADHAVQLAARARTITSILPALRTAHDDGVVVKLSVYAPPEDSLPVSTFEDAFTTTPTEVRRRSNPAPFLALVDGDETYFGLRSDPVEYGVHVDDNALTSMLYWYFQFALWESWDAVYAVGPERPSGEYVEIRQCIRDVASRVERGEDVRATIEGYDIATGERRELTGHITEVGYPGESPSTDTWSGQFAGGQAMLVLDAGHDTYSVGGFGAILEDVRATHIHVHDVRDEDRQG